MLILVTGGSKCGKSRFAENLIEKNYFDRDVKKYYVATMEPFSKDAGEIIKRHRDMRSGKDFETIEKYRDIDKINVDKSSVILLECVGNLCANEMFSGEYNENVFEKVSGEIIALSMKCELLIAITNQVGEDGMEYLSETKKYIENMGKINERLAFEAEMVVEMVYGIPLYLKGNKN